ncbi:MAG TPA: hypothetical protein VJP79_09610 [Nitrososphaera sp.]|nr:hypothetical protein [Nitrososphaera sp.]
MTIRVMLSAELQADLNRHIDDLIRKLPTLKDNYSAESKVAKTGGFKEGVELQVRVISAVFSR